MTRYVIETGGERWHQFIKSAPSDRTASRAIIDAFKRKAPKNPGVIISVKTKARPQMFYATIKYLRLAGYRIVK